MMKLLFTKKNVPYIDLENYGRLIFSTLTAHPEKGFKYMAYSNTYDDVVSIKKVKDGETQRITKKVSARDSYIFNMFFKRDADGKKGIPNGTIPRKLASFLSKKFEPLLIDGYMPYENINKLEKIISKNDNIDKIITKRNKSVKSTNRKKTKRAKKAK